MAPAVRLLRIMIATIICIVLFACLHQFFSAVLDGYVDGPTSAFGVLFWGSPFRAPAHLNYGTIP